MIKKILQLKNVGSYRENPIENCTDWNGEFKKNTIIYGENGVGKTTLSLLMGSLKGNTQILREKISFGSDGTQSASILLDDNSKCVYKNGVWDKNMPNIEIFDIHFIEDNIYVGSSISNSNRQNLFGIIAGKRGLDLHKKLQEEHSRKDFWMKERNELKYKLRYAKSHLTQKEFDKLKEEINSVTSEIKFASNGIGMFNIELGEYLQSIFDERIEVINQFLNFFTPHIQLQKFSKVSANIKQLVSYSLSVNGETVGFPNMKGGSQRTIKYTLSEGDKSAFAFAFFLAKLSTEDISQKIIVFDDPISSFDMSRKTATINRLIRISRECKQFFVFTHDIYFAREISRKLESNNTINLQIKKRDNKSTVAFHDIEQETLTAIFKDINVLNEYLSNGADNEFKKREVIRCIRPIIEGILRIKYFNVIRRDEWLGNMIDKIRNSSSGDRLFKLKNILDDIIEVNDYSKEFHHSDPSNPWGDIILDEELRLYVNKTLSLIDEI
jgi:wobble nucleotide-excising tRNase